MAAMLARLALHEATAPNRGDAAVQAAQAAWAEAVAAATAEAEEVAQLQAANGEAARLLWRARYIAAWVAAVTDGWCLSSWYLSSQLQGSIPLRAGNHHREH